MRKSDKKKNDSRFFQLKFYEFFLPVQLAKIRKSTVLYFIFLDSLKVLTV